MQNACQPPIVAVVAESPLSLPPAHWSPLSSEHRVQQVLSSWLPVAQHPALKISHKDPQWYLLLPLMMSLTALSLAVLREHFADTVLSPVSVGGAHHHGALSLAGQCTLFDAPLQNDPIQPQDCWSQDMWTREGCQETTVQ